MKSFIILDRSGSMTSRWEETKVALDSYVKALDAKTKVWLAAFDNEYTLVFDGINARTWNGLPDDIQPRSMTALFDAIGRMGGSVSEHAKRKAQIVILTDGAENASREVSKASARNIVDQWKADNYDVVFLGADFDAMSAASSVGISAGQTLNYASTRASYTGTMLGERAGQYMMTGKSPVWTPDQRTRAVGN